MWTGFRKYIFACLTLAVFIAVALSGERAALLQICISIVVIVSVIFFKYKTKLTLGFWFLSIVGILAILIVAGLIIYLLNPVVIQRQFFSIIDAVMHYQNSHHIYLWLKGLKAGFSSIIFGIGPNQFEAFCKAARLSETEFAVSYHPHNVYIEFFAEGGLIGLTLFLFFLCALLKKLIRALNKSQNIYKTILLIGTAMAAFQRLLPFIPSSSFFKTWYAVPIWFAIGLMAGLIDKKQTRNVTFL